ncbi:MAG: HAMP domain-containing sensor histidine kinase [Ignavibacteriaceae bacterium]
MLSIKLKIVLAYTVVFGMLLSLFAYIIYQSTEKVELTRLDTNLKTYSILLQSEFEEQSQQEKAFNYLELKAIPADGLKRSRFQLLDNNGKIILGDTILTNLNSAIVKTISDGHDKYEEIRIGKHHARIYLGVVEINEKVNYVLVVSSSLEEVREDLERLLVIFLFVIPVGLLLAGFSAFLIAKRAFRPINKMIKTANEISARSLDKRLDVPETNDEVKALSVTLNSMVDRLDKTFKSHRQFIADASHEIRTPLTIIQAELELSLKNKNALNTTKSINTALSEINNLNRLSNSLLILAKIDASKNRLILSQVRIDELILECVQSLNSLAVSHNNKINISVDEAIEIKADLEKVKSIVFNLLENALKYSGTNKQIKIELKKQGAKKIDIIVSDNGSGISENDVPHIFERFYRSSDLRSTVDGNGLGLAIVKEFVEMHSGKITASSKPGNTTFVVTLPLEQR